jgi:hypothetical protein
MKLYALLKISDGGYIQYDDEAMRKFQSINNSYNFVLNDKKSKIKYCQESLQSCYKKLNNGSKEFLSNDETPTPDEDLLMLRSKQYLSMNIKVLFRSNIELNKCYEGDDMSRLFLHDYLTHCSTLDKESYDSFLKQELSNFRYNRFPTDSKKLEQQIKTCVENNKNLMLALRKNTTYDNLLQNVQNWLSDGQKEFDKNFMQMVNCRKLQALLKISSYESIQTMLNELESIDKFGSRETLNSIKSGYNISKRQRDEILELSKKTFQSHYENSYYKKSSNKSKVLFLSNDQTTTDYEEGKKHQAESLNNKFQDPKDQETCCRIR